MYATRLKAVVIVLGLGMLALMACLLRIQVLQGARYREEAEQRLKRPPGFHPTIRGALLDRSGLLLAQDTGAFDVGVYFPFVEMTDGFVRETAKRWHVPEDEVRGRIARMWSELARLTGVPPEELARRAETIRARVEVIRQCVCQVHGRPIRVREETYGEPTSVAHPIVYDVDLKTVGVVSSRADDFPGLVVQTTCKREYPYGAAAPHVLGRLGEVTNDELAGDINAHYPPGHLKRYWPGDWVGRGGVEGVCEEMLRGSRGMFQKGIEGNFLEDIPPVPGRDVHLTLDIALQADAEALLDRPPAGSAGHRHAGAAVVLDCRTGEALVLASAPRYDVRYFQADFPDLANDPAGPLVNRAVCGTYPLGSVFKAVTATAALHEGVLTPQNVLACDGMLDPATPNHFRCHIFLSHGYGHGALQLRTAIQKSCNVFFYQVAERLGRTETGKTDLRLARERLQKWANLLGLGRPTGIGLPGEPAGCIDVPDPRNMAVGQGELLVTPLQAAQVYALVATDGRMPPLRLIRERPPAQAGRPGLQLNPAIMAVIRDAFAAVVNEPGGTGYGTANLPDIRIAGKTGTAQAGSGGDHAWFVGFAPAENPKIAFAVIVEHGGHGGETAGPIAREIVKACQAHGYLDDQPRPPADIGKTPSGNRNNARPAPPKPDDSAPRPAPQPVG